MKYIAVRENNITASYFFQMILKMLSKTKLKTFDYDLFPHLNNKLLREVTISVLLLINPGSSIMFSTKYTVYNYFHINPRALNMLINWVKNLRDCSLPSLVQHHAMKSLLRLWFLRREKKAQEWQSVTPPRLWVASWEPLLWSCTTRILGKSLGLKYWESDCDKRQGGYQQPVLQFHGLNFYLQGPSSSSNQRLCSSSEPSWFEKSDQATWWGPGLTDLGLQKRSFSCPGAWSVHVQADTES